MVYSREDLREQLKRREIAPVYVLFGPEVHLRDLAAKTIADLSFAPGELRDFNETSFSLNVEGNLQKALAAAQQLPMLAAKRVIRINDVRVSASGFRDTVTEDHERILAAYCADPAPHAVVVFLADELNGVRKMGRFLREKTAAVDFASLSDKQLDVWARREFVSSGADIDESTLKYFLARVGADVARLNNEIKKVAAASLPNGTVTPELIEAIVSNSSELTNFELTDHLVAGRPVKALAALKKILDDGAEPLALLGLMSYNYRRLLIAKDLMSRGAARADVAASLKLRYNDQERFIAAARRADMHGLRRAVELMAKTDIAIKSSIGGSDNARMLIEVLVCELCGLMDRNARIGVFQRQVNSG